MIPASFTAVGGPTATASTRKPWASSWVAIVDASGEAWVRPVTAAKAPFTTRTVAPLGSTAVASDIFVAESKGTNLLSFGRSEATALRGGGANGRVHGILPAIRTGEGGDSQNV